MFNQHDIAVLSRALRDGLISVEQYTHLLRLADRVRKPSVETLLISEAGLTQDQVVSLRIDPDELNRATVADAPAGDVHRDETIVYQTDHPQADKTEQPQFDQTEIFSKSDDGLGRTTVPENQRPGQSTPTASCDTLDSRLRFETARELARGGLGRVLLAHDSHLDRDVAIKEMLGSPMERVERVERFFHEAQLTGQLEHPGIVPVYAVGVSHMGLPFYAMKLIHGRTLYEMIQEVQEIPAKDPEWETKFHELIRIVIETCNAVAFAHSKGILHRDIKPHNIMVGTYGETMLVDWGLARRFGSDFEEHSPTDEQSDAITTHKMGAEHHASGTHVETREGTVVGTPVYMAPEQAMGEVGTLDQRADVYALGATLYEVITGQNAYGPQPTSLMQRVCKGDIVPPREVVSNISRPLEAICRKALALDREERYATALELANDLKAWQSGQVVTAYDEPIWTRAARWARRHRTWFVSTTTASFAILFVVLAWGIKHRSDINNARSQAQAALEAGRDAHQNGELDTALENFGKAAGRTVDRPELVNLSHQIDWSQRQVRREIKQQQNKQIDRDKIPALRKHYGDAMIFGMLASGADPVDNARRAQDASRAAWKLFGGIPSTPHLPDFSREYYSPQESEEIESRLRRLRWIYFDSVIDQQFNASDRQKAAAQQVLKWLKEIPKEERTSHANLLREALYAAKAGDQDTAGKLRELAEDIPPTTADDFFLLADFQYRHQDFVSAAASFSAALLRQPENFWAQFFLGACQVRLQDYPAAIASFTACANRRPAVSHIYLLRGYAFGETEQYDAADTDFLRVAELSPDEYGLLLNRGAVYLRSGRREKAARDFEKAIVARPEDYQGYLNLAETQRAEAKSDDALATIEKGLNCNAGKARLLRTRALICLEENRLDLALDAFKEAEQATQPGGRLHATILLEKARLLIRQGNADKAAEVCQQVATLRADLPAAQHILGLACVADNRLAEAIVALGKYLDMTQADTAQLLATSQGRRLRAAVFRERGLARLKTGDDAGAMEDFARCTALVPDSSFLPAASDQRRQADLYSHRGWAYLLKSQKLALAEFDAAVKLSPNDGEPYTGRGYVRALLGDHQGAIADAQQATKLGPPSAGLHFNVAGIYAEALKQLEKQGDQDQAADQCRAQAIQSLQACLKLAGPQKAFFLQQIKTDPALDPLRDAKAFQQLK